MKFSVIMPSLLADYPGAAKKRDQKLVRAINSVLAQSFTDFELIVISDGCDLTDYYVKQMLSKDSRLRLLRVERGSKLWSNAPRNAGIQAANGEYIIYLDNDDMYGPDHLKIFAENLNGEDWVYSNDFLWYDGQWKERITDVKQYGRCGTSNICHASRLGLLWMQDGYGHDYHFIQQLLKFPNYKQVPTAQYHVCHFNGSEGV